MDCIRHSSQLGGESVLSSISWVRSLGAGSLFERPNRFVVHCQLESSGELVAVSADPGRLKELLVPGAALFAPAAEPQARWSVILVQVASSV